MPTITLASRPAALATRLGHDVARYGVALVLLAIGLLKFTAGEAEGIRRLVETSPLLRWTHAAWGVQGASNAIGVVEVLAALLIALRPLSPRLAAAGSALAVATFATTLSFLVTAPGAWDAARGFPALGGTGQFIVKDVVLLGASLWSLGESLGASRQAPRAPRVPRAA
jgi:uncharacterized membrane protein YkgB